MRFVLKPVRAARLFREALELRALKTGWIPSVTPLGIHRDQVRRILVLDPSFPTLGGGEKDMGLFCQAMERIFPQAQIDLAVHNLEGLDVHAADYPEITALNQRFGISLRRTRLLKIHLTQSGNSFRRLTRNRLLIENLTRGYDVFVNYMFLSNHRGHATINLYRCMFPPPRRAYGALYTSMAQDSLDEGFIRSYHHFLMISKFTGGWMNTFWGERTADPVLYPPALVESPADERYSEGSKRNVILAVGRFQAGGHNKRQDALVGFFRNNPSIFDGWELHLVGGLSDLPADQDFADAVRRNALGAPIHLHLNCELAELSALYRCAKIFWHATGFGEEENDAPEKMEHFGITTVEAMSYGAVPIVIRRGGQIEIISDGLDGFLWETEEECVSQTRRLIEDDALRAKTALAAVRKSGSFSVERFQTSIAEFFAALLPDRLTPGYSQAEK
jgi:glycosyltransferase involved in cell wall biosynthesis